jgi:hypothetical protein
MPVKIFSGTAEGAAELEKKVNEWLGRLETGAVRSISTAGGPGSQQVVVTIWYTESKDMN